MVFVELVDGNANAPYEIILEKTEKSDLEQLAERIKGKNKKLAGVFLSGNYSFETERVPSE